LDRVKDGASAQFFYLVIASTVQMPRFKNSQTFVGAIGQTVRGRQRLDYAPVGENAWVLRDLSAIPKALATQHAGEN